MAIMVKVERLMDGAKLPKQAHHTDAGYDLYTPVDFELYPSDRLTVDIGIRIELPEGYEAQIRSRSGLAANSGIFILNSPGTIDSSYRGRVGVILYNTTLEVHKFNAGDRVAQMVIKEVPKVSLEEGPVFTDTDRGENGVGSTGA